MKKNELQIISPDPTVHTDEMLDMCAKVFSPGSGYFAMHKWSRDSYVLNSRYDWNASSIGLIDDRIVTHYGIWDYTMRIGAARVRVGGVGYVATHGDFRKRGLMSQTVQASIDRMREMNYDMSMLFGIGGFYERFGYVLAWSSVKYSFEIKDLPTDKPKHRISKFSPEPREDLDRLYNRENATRTGTAVKPTFLRNQHPDSWVGYLWKDRDGKVAGYVIVSHQRADDMECIECCGDDAEILLVLATLARRWHCRNLHFSTLHYNHPLRKRIERMTCWERARHYAVGDGGPMILTVNLKSTLIKMEKELSRRLKNSNLADWRGRLLVSDAREKVSLVIDRSQVRVAAPVKSKHKIIGGNELARLLIGSEEPAEVIEAGRMKLTGDAAALVEVLFPNQHPMLNKWDRY